MLVFKFYWCEVQAIISQCGDDSFTIHSNIFLLSYLSETIESHLNLPVRELQDLKLVILYNFSNSHKYYVKGNSQSCQHYFNSMAPGTICLFNTRSSLKGIHSKVTAMKYTRSRASGKKMESMVTSIPKGGWKTLTTVIFSKNNSQWNQISPILSFHHTS